MHERLDAYFTDEGTPLEERVRVAAAIGVVMGTFTFLAADSFSAEANEELQTLLVDAINDVLELGRSQLRRPRPAGTPFPPHPVPTLARKARHVCARRETKHATEAG
jgi:hypothetical protein